MKKSYAFALMSGLLMLGSCASDAPEYPQMDPIDEEGNIGYIKFTINNSDTRAAEEDKGTTDESAIDHIDFLFTGVDGKRFKGEAKKADIDGNQAVIKLKAMPKYVAVIVNGNGNYDNITDLTKDEYTVDHYTNPNAGENEQFYMSSTRYYGTGNQRVYRTDIAANQVFKSEDEAKSASGNKVVSLTVERYVAKVNVKSGIELAADGTINPLTDGHEHDVKNNGADAKVTFTPEFVFLTGVNDKTFRVKDLPSWNDLGEELQVWHQDAGKRSFWVGKTAGAVRFQTLNMLNGTNTTNADKTWAKWVKPFEGDGADKVFYPFENQIPGAEQSDYAKKTSVVVAGKYTVTDAAGADLADTDGTFYLVAFENNFIVCKTEPDAIKAMGGSETDVLVPEGEGATDLTQGYSDSSWTGWTGWMKIKGSNNVIRCVKYNGGYGYYSKEIVRFTGAETYEAIVRNHLYTINIKGISGMGVGIPDPDQPIINIPNPDPTEQNYFLNMSVTVAPWKVVPAQDAEWK
ncbi:MAG: fimbria major subunit [Muribaculaceae bacterium]|nr:fimbria major subunit [Muribaculaceae bacterium]